MLTITVLLTAAGSLSHGWRICAKITVTFELRDIKSTIKMSRQKQRKKRCEEMEKEVNLKKFLQETKERIQHQK